MSSWPCVQPVSIVEPEKGTYVILDPNVGPPAVIRPPSGGIDKVTYQSLGLPWWRGAKRFRLQYFTFTSDLYNIKDESAFGGLKNNVLIVDGHTVTITPGNWAVDTFCVELAALMNAADPGKTFTVTYNPITISITVSALVAFVLDMRGNSPWYEMGFQQALYGSTTSITGIGSYNFSGPVTLFVQINEIVTNNLVYYDQFAFKFVYPLISETPGIGQANLITAGKLDCWAEGDNTLTQLTVSLFYPHGGKVYPLIDGPYSTYQMTLGIFA